MTELTLHLPTGTGRKSPVKAAQTARDELVDVLEQRLRTLPDKLTWEQGTRFYKAVRAYETLGRDLIHLLRYCLGVSAFRMKTESTQGDAVAKECSDRWGVPVSTLRLYMRVVRHTGEDIRQFNAYLQSEKDRYKSIEAVRDWCQLIEDEDLLPEDAAREQRMRQVERGAEMIEQALAEETDPETRETIVQVQASASGIEIGYTDDDETEGLDETPVEPLSATFETSGPKIYLAARYSRAEQMRGVRDRLEKYGFVIVSRWIEGGHELSKEGSTEAHFMERKRFAREDWEDMLRSDIVVSFTEEPRTTKTRGGRHVEFGGALALGKRVIVVGHRENVFHCLDEVEFFDDQFAMMTELIEEIEARPVRVTPWFVGDVELEIVEP